MSLIGFQSAAAAIIRCPRQTYNWKPEQFLKDFDLSSDERKIIMKLSQHDELNKYGTEQAHGRWEVCMRHCDRVPEYVPDRVLKNIWFQLFEPKNLYASSDLNGYFANSIQFMDFLLTDKDARKRLRRSSPDFIFDMIAFEKAELELARPLTQDPALHPKSKLSHPHFRIVDLSFDIPALIENPDVEDSAEFERKHTLVFIRSEDKYAPRIFEINASMRSFLLDQYAGGSAHVPSSEIKADLLTMGLLSI